MNDAMSFVNCLCIGGDLAFVDAEGHLVPAVWPEAAGLYAKPMDAVRKVLNLGKVTGVFLDKHIINVIRIKRSYGESDHPGSELGFFLEVARGRGILSRVPTAQK